jgi:hypothetical protein
VPVKWFTREWVSGQLPDEEWEKRRREYVAHLDAIGHHFRDGTEELIASLNLHDAQILSESAAGTTFNLQVLAGDLQRGYERISLVYGDAVVNRPNSTPLDDTGFEIVADEVDLGPGGLFEHRFLLAPDGEVEIQFKRLFVAREPASASERR